MTQTINGHDRRQVTDGDDARMRVRAPGNPAEAADRPDSGPKSAFTHVHARAVPDHPEEIKESDDPRLRDVVSLHGREAAKALNQSWLFTEVPQTAGEAWKAVAPPKGEASGKAAWLAMTAAGLFRALAVTVLHLFLLAVDTRTRAGVALIVTVLACAGSCAGHTL